MRFKGFLLVFGLWAACFPTWIAAAGDKYGFAETFFDAAPPLPPPGWSVSNANGDTQTWESRKFGGDQGGACVRYLSNPIEAADDWLYSPSVNLVSGVTYRLSFRTCVTSALRPPNALQVWVGPTSVTMTTQIVSLPSITHTDIRETTATFTVGASGSYCLGFRCVSPADALGLYLDTVVVAADEPDLQLVLQMDKPFYNSGDNTYTAGESMGCLIYVENQGSSAVTVNGLMTVGLEPDPLTVLAFRVTDPDGLVVDSHARFKPGVPTPSDFKTLQPGEIAYKFYDLQDSGYQFSKLGIYTIQAVYRSYYALQTQTVWRGQLVSSPVAVELIP